MKFFLSNPYLWFLRTFLKKEPKTPSLIFMHMMDVTHDGWLQRMHNNNNVSNYSYELYTKTN